MKKVLFVAAEAFPFAKTGGLADVIGSLPKALLKEGVDARVILPKYGDIQPFYKQKMEHLAYSYVPMSWRRAYVGVDRLKENGVTFYFIDNEQYFKRPGYYGYYDDGERFTFFNRAVLELLPYIGFSPDVLHCHDWHAGAIPVLLAAHYRHLYPCLRTVFTIHNLKYQGVFDRAVLGDLMELGPDYFAPDKLEFHGAVNFMKAGLVYADRITTVSRSYAGEIQMEYYGEGLDGLLRARHRDLRGITNGIDYEVFDPQQDMNVFRHYGRKDCAKARAVNKKKLQEHLGLPQRPEVPIIAIVSRLVESKGLNLIAHVLGELAAMDIQLVVLGTGDNNYESMFHAFAHAYPDKIAANIFFDESLAHKIYAGADIMLMPSQFEPCGIGQLIAMRYGCIPVVRQTGGLADTITPYNSQTMEGTGFSFAHYNAHEMLFTLKTAMELYRDKKSWNKLMENAMSMDFSWQRSAKEYVDIYQHLE